MLLFFRVLINVNVASPKIWLKSRSRTGQKSILLPYPSDVDTASCSFLSFLKDARILDRRINTLYYLSGVQMANVLGRLRNTAVLYPPSYKGLISGGHKFPVGFQVPAGNLRKSGGGDSRASLTALQGASYNTIVFFFSPVTSSTIQLHCNTVFLDFSLKPTFWVFGIP